MTDDSTRWSLSAVEGFSSSLDITLSVDTAAEAVTEAIERAAASNGILLQRIVEDDGDDQAETAEEGEGQRPPAIAPGSVANLVVTGQADTRDR